MTTTFATMAVQDLARAPLRLGEELGVSVVDLLRSATGEDGNKKLNSFRARTTRASGVPFAMPNGVVLHQRFMPNSMHRMAAVSLSDVPISLGLMLNKTEATNALARPDLLATLVRHGMNVEDATNAIADAMSMVSPDLETAEHVKELFGGTQVVRCTNVSGPNGTLIRVFSAIDIAMAAKKCTKVTAQKVVYTLFRNYHEVDLEKTPMTIGNQRLADGIQLHWVRFRTNQGTLNGGSLCLALDAKDSGMLLGMIGGNISKAVDYEKMIIAGRFLECDETLCQEMQENRAIGPSESYRKLANRAVVTAIEMDRADAAVVKVEFIYASASTAFPGHIKIGRTGNVAKRLSSGNTFCAMAPHVELCSTKTLDSKRDEALAHTFFAELRRAGEFFEVSVDAVHAYFQDVISVRFAHEEAELLREGGAVSTVQSEDEDEDEESFLSMEDVDELSTTKLPQVMPHAEVVAAETKKRRAFDMDTEHLVTYQRNVASQAVPTETAESDGSALPLDIKTVKLRRSEVRLKRYEAKLKMSEVKLQMTELKLKVTELKYEAMKRELTETESQHELALMWTNVVRLGVGAYKPHPKPVFVFSSPREDPKK